MSTPPAQPHFTLRIVRASSREKLDLLAGRRDELHASNVATLYEDLEPDQRWWYTAASPEARAKALESALTETTSDFVISARGGYGASDLLPLLDWQRIGAAKPKIVIGFSDVSAIHSALYTRFKRVGLHAPMPATTLWRKDGENVDVDCLLETLKTLKAGREAVCELPLTRISGKGTAINGQLFGGCFTVLTALTGTPYLPKTLGGHIVFLEDTDENPGRIMRCLNHWLQSGHMEGVRGVILGNLRGLGQNVPDSAPFVLEEFARRVGDIPVYHSPNFGHTSPNMPMMVGADAVLENDRLVWRHRASTSLA